MLNKRMVSILLILVLLFTCTLSGGCEDKSIVDVDGNKKEQVLRAGEYQVYYLNDNKTTLKSKVFKPEEKNDIVDVADELISELNKALIDENADISMQLKVLDLISTGDIMIVNLDESIHEIEKVTRILLRACIVLTLTQIPGVNYVQITVKGQTIKDEAGNKIGNMKADDFVNFKDNFPDTKKEVTLVLYYADESGSMLRKKEKVCYYDYTISYEEFVVRNLLEDVSEQDEKDGYRETFPKDMIIDMVYTKDGVCYVDFDQSIMDLVRAVSPDLMLYSIVNSLSELSYITKVQFSVEGEGDVSLYNHCDLSQPFSRNLDIVVKEVKTD